MEGISVKYLGIDAGGTKTGFCLTGENFNILSEYQAAGCYYPVIGKDGVINIIKTGIEKCLKNAGIDGIEKENIDAAGIKACCGLPSYGELENLMLDLPEIKSSLPVETEFCNDVEVCHAGALGGLPGITVVSGTGSIGFGRDESGKTARSGGFGPEPGGDEGSAYYIGMKLIQKFTRQSDYRENRTALYGEVKKSLGLKSDFDICNYMLETVKSNRESIAELAKLAHNIAASGDAACRSIFSEADYEIYLLAAAVKKQLDFTGLPVKVSYAGGVFKAGDLIIPELGGLLKKKTRWFWRK
jgi:N-acetylglucosamine kinase-like BadF-type ATPase